eukprot:10373872-Alexandrium_andersonii.AAC.1
MWAIGGSPDTPVPERQQKVSEFVAWYVHAYNANGEKLKNRLLPNTPLDWNTGRGEFLLTCSKQEGRTAYDT